MFQMTFCLNYQLTFFIISAKTRLYGVTCQKRVSSQLPQRDLTFICMMLICISINSMNTRMIGKITSQILDSGKYSECTFAKCSIQRTADHALQVADILEPSIDKHPLHQICGKTSVDLVHSIYAP
jgi:hypothetical protein